MLLVILLILLVIFLIPRYKEPRIINNILTEEECNYIINKSRKLLKPSTIGKDAVLDENVRISDTAWLDTEDPILQNIAQRCLKHINKPIENCEKLQVVRYKPGGHYAPHQDAFKHEANKRMYTFILALNDGYDGGETVFPEINKAYKLAKGDCLLFNTLDNYNLHTKYALHGGSTLLSNEKWICNLWVHINRYERHP